MARASFKHRKARRVAKHPLAEVFGYPIDNQSPEAVRHRSKRLCPFNNKVPNCTKDKANDPLGVCSIRDGETIAITCPVRFRENWLIADQAADFFFSPDATWTSLIEVRLNDKQGKSAGNIDIVLVSYDERGRIVDFGAVEVQAVYISGNVRAPFEFFMQQPSERQNMDWRGQPGYPRADYLSSSRKRLAPQLLFKGGILHSWHRKQAVVLHSEFFNTLPKLAEVDNKDAEIAWIIYDLTHDQTRNVYELQHTRTVYTHFEPAMLKLTTADAGPVENFIQHLQSKLDQKLDTPPDAPALTDVVLT
jgi:Restriction endonuclease NotI